MLKRSFVRSVPFILVSWIYMMRTLSVGNSVFKFIGYSEALFPILLVPLCAFLLYDRTEIELALVSGTRTSKLFFTKLVPVIVYTAIPMIAFLFIIPGRTQEAVDPTLVVKGSPIPEYVPENYRFYVAVSMLVTLTFFFALYSFIRVVTRNCYIPMLVCFGLGAGINSFSANVLTWHLPLTRCLFDPMIGTYFIGNEVPAVFAEKYPELAGMTNIWTYNRFLFIGISAVIFFITYLILRREKLHCGIGE